MSMAAPSPENLPAMSAGEAAAVQDQQSAIESGAGYVFMGISSIAGEIAEIATKNDVVAEGTLGAMAVVCALYAVGTWDRAESAQGRRMQARLNEKDRIGARSHAVFFSVGQI